MAFTMLVAAFAGFIVAGGQGALNGVFVVVAIDALIRNHMDHLKGL